MPFTPDNMPKEYGVLESLFLTFGRELEVVNGVPTTRLRSPLAPDDTEIKVETLLAFPDDGSVWVGGLSFSYTELGSYSLVGASNAAPRVITFPAGTPVTLDVRAIKPDQSLPVVLEVPAGGFDNGFDSGFDGGVGAGPGGVDGFDSGFDTGFD